MTLHNYWWLLIWLFLFGGVCLAFFPKRHEYVLGQRVIRWNWLPALTLALPYVLWAGWRSDAFGDTTQYRITFNNMPVGISGLPSYVASMSKDRGFGAVEYAFKSLVSQDSKAFFLLIAAIQILCLVVVYRKYSRNYWLSFFFFVASTDYLAWMHNGMRQFLAAAFIFAFLPLLVQRRYMQMTVVVLLASQIHLTALLFLPFIFIVNGRAWNLRTLGFIVAVILSVVFLDRVTGYISSAMRETVYKGEVSLLDSSRDDGTNIMRVLFYSVPAVMSWLFRPYIDRADDPLINVCANLSIVAAGFYVFSFFTSGILMGRVPIYFSLANYILIPWFITEVFDEGSAVAIDVIFVAVYSFFFYYQAGVTWKLL